MGYMSIHTSSAAGASPSYTRSITIDHTKCGSADSSNFPVLVSLSGTTLKTVANGGHVNRSDGYDIGFYSDSAHTSKYNWAVEYYDPVGGVLVAWVKIPTVSHTSDTVFYINYGNTTITTFQGGAVGTVYSNGYAAVYWMSEATGASLVDQTGNGNSGTPTVSNPTQVSGKVDGALSFANASSQYFDCGTMTSVDNISNYSIGYWGKRVSTSYLVMAGKNAATVNNYVYGGSVMNFTVRPAQASVSTGNGYVDDANWHHYYATFDGTQGTANNRPLMYFDGTSRTMSITGTFPQKQT